jgi:hypothetical protein
VLLPRPDGAAQAQASHDYSRALFLRSLAGDAQAPPPQGPASPSAQVLPPDLGMYLPYLDLVLQRKLNSSLELQAAGLPLAQRVAMLLASFNGNTYTTVPYSAAPSLVAAAKPALLHLQQAIFNNDQHQLFLAIVCFLLVPQFALLRPANVVPASSIAAGINKFVDGKASQPRVSPAPRVPPEAPKDFLSPEEQAAVRRAGKLAQMGRLGHAINALEGACQQAGGVLEPTAENIARLAALHPAASASPLPSLPECPARHARLAHHPQASSAESGQRLCPGRLWLVRRTFPHPLGQPRL